MSHEPPDHQARLRAALQAMWKQQARIEQLERALAPLREPIAVVGIGCRFPGGANGPAAFWDRLRGGFDAIREVPAERWPADALYDANPDAPGRIATRFGGFLDDIDRFDARFFQISPREAQTMDPQQRLLLEIAWEALEHAGIPPLSLAGTATGVFVGITAVDYARVIYRDDLARIDTYCATGNVANIAAGRLSYVLGLRGPSVAMDTACSSSLVALHLACQSLRTGEGTMALAAGVNLILTPDNSVAVSRAHMLSPDGRCKAFDRAANGYGRSEGCGVVVLKPLSRARADGNRVLGTILGSAVRQDGQRAGLTVPNGLAQQAVMRAALENARVAPADVGYVEAHGTGTSLGDPIEFEALGAVYGEARDRSHPLVVGSLKTNVGHMESAAGIGGLIKALLTVRAGEIPPHLHFREPNPDIALESVPAVVPTRAMAWPAAYARRVAAVSSFGSSGTIAHVLIAGADDEPVQEAEPGLNVSGGRLQPPLAQPDGGSEVDRDLVLPLSARSDRALAELTARYEERLSNASDAELADIAFTAGAGRSHFDKRIAVVGASAADMARKLARGEVVRADGERASGIRTGDPIARATEYVRGGDVDWAALQPGRRTDVPTYPFQRERHWVDEPAGVPAARIGAARPAAAPARAGMRFGVMFFNGSEARDGTESYRLMLEAARFADAHGLSSVWLPERHFTGFGSLYPNPATLHAALARETAHVRLMAGSVVLPLHNPMRLAEEWAVVDNLSGGRVGMSFASGWNPDDFALQPDAYTSRQEELFAGIELLRTLWRGEHVTVRNGKGQEVSLRTYPTPVQRELPLWVTAASNPETFRRAGAAGANLLTHLLDHDVDELAAKIAVYRHARADGGHDPDEGQVTVMLHTFLGATIEEVHEKAREPYCNYLEDNINLLAGLASSRGSSVDPRTLSRQDLDGLVGFLYDRFCATRALLGTVDGCLPLVGQLERAGVNEIACLLDFGPAANDVLAHLPNLVQLAERASVRRPGPVVPALDEKALYEIAWVETGIAPVTSSIPPALAVIADSNGKGARIAQHPHLAQAAGLDAARLDSDDGAAEVARALVATRSRDVLCAWHLDAGDDIAPSLMRVTRLVRALGVGDVRSTDPDSRTPSRHPVPQGPRVWLLTRGAQMMPGSAHPPAPAQAGMWGFAKVLPIEQGAIWGGVMDLDPVTPPEASVPVMLGALAHATREDQVMIRGRSVLAARLRPPANGPTVEPRPWSCRPGAAYLVTGGFGGIGIDAARWLASRGARQLVLLGRTVRADPRLSALEQQGVSIERVAVDIAQAGALADWLRRRGTDAAPICGVIHAAGVWSDRPVATLDEATIAAVLAPKVAGSLALDAAFPPGSLDFFVAFSAFSSLLPAEGQGNYAAANAFMDGLVQRRRAQGDRALAVNWGPWSDVGFATTEYGRRAHERLQALGISRLTPAEGWQWLERVLTDDRGQVGVMLVDWRTLFRADPNARLSPLLGELASTWARAAADAVGTSAGQLAEALAGRDTAAQLAEILRALMVIVSEVIRLEPHEIDTEMPLTELGLDSLMAVEIKNRVQHESGVDVPLVQLLQGPTLSALAASVLASVKVSALASADRSTGTTFEEIEL